MKAVKNTPRLLKNVTLCATISSKGTEFIRYFSEGGTKNKLFEEYFIELLRNLRNKYKEKKLVIIMDNLHAHKTSFILGAMRMYPKI